MYVVEFTERELMLARSALHSYLDDFGHAEQDLVNELKTLIEKLPEPAGTKAPDDPTAVSEL